MDFEKPLLKIYVTAFLKKEINIFQKREIEKNVKMKKTLELATSKAPNEYFTSRTYFGPIGKGLLSNLSPYP